MQGQALPFSALLECFRSVIDFPLLPVGQEEDRGEEGEEKEKGSKEDESLRSCPTVLWAVSPELLRQVEKIRAYRRLSLRCAPAMRQNQGSQYHARTFGKSLVKYMRKIFMP